MLLHFMLNISLISVRPSKVRDESNPVSWYMRTLSISSSEIPLGKQSHSDSRDLSNME